MTPDTHHPDHAAYAATLAPRQLELARWLATPVTAETSSIDAEMLAALRRFIEWNDAHQATLFNVLGAGWAEHVDAARAAIQRAEAV